MYAFNSAPPQVLWLLKYNQENVQSSVCLSLSHIYLYTILLPKSIFTIFPLLLSVWVFTFHLYTWSVIFISDVPQVFLIVPLATHPGAIQPQESHTFQGRVVWIRNVRHEKTEIQKKKKRRETQDRIERATKWILSLPACIFHMFYIPHPQGGKARLLYHETNEKQTN